MTRTVSLERKTAETEISLTLNLDGEGKYQVQTGIGFFDHMLAHLAYHGCFDLSLVARGDLEIDAHHTVEDVGIVFGAALAKAVGAKEGIARYGNALVPMDEALVLAVLDLSGRPFLGYTLPVTGKVGEIFEVELAKEFFQAVSRAGLNIHLQMLAGENRHHILEAAFKAFGRALREAVSLDQRRVGIPSTKGRLI